MNQPDEKETDLTAKMFQAQGELNKAKAELRLYQCEQAWTRYGIKRGDKVIIKHGSKSAIAVDWDSPTHGWLIVAIIKKDGSQSRQTKMVFQGWEKA